MRRRSRSPTGPRVWIGSQVGEHTDSILSWLAQDSISAAAGPTTNPYRGFETVTYMIDGTFQHQDSNGGGGLITDIDTQWMTAGAALSFHQHR
jgi:redox-sensitive bicupin YhaK (pirin superfamily)